MTGWSGDLHELTWFFIKSPQFGFHFGKVEQPKHSWSEQLNMERKPTAQKYKCWFFKFAWWGVHISYAVE